MAFDQWVLTKTFSNLGDLNGLYDLYGLYNLYVLCNLVCMILHLFANVVCPGRGGGNVLACIHATLLTNETTCQLFPISLQLFAIIVCQGNVLACIHATLLTNETACQLFPITF